MSKKGVAKAMAAWMRAGAELSVAMHQITARQIARDSERNYRPDTAAGRQAEARQRQALAEAQLREQDAARARLHTHAVGTEKE